MQNLFFSRYETPYLCSYTSLTHTAEAEKDRSIRQERFFLTYDIKNMFSCMGPESPAPQTSVEASKPQTQDLVGLVSRWLWVMTWKWWQWKARMVKPHLKCSWIHLTYWVSLMSCCCLPLVCEYKFLPPAHRNPSQDAYRSVE